MKRAFTLIEMLLVIGIIFTLIGASIAGFSSMKRTADKARAQELCIQVKTALEAIYNDSGAWPRKIIVANSQADSKVDENVAYVIARYKIEEWDQNSRFDVNYDNGSKKTVGLDRFGILDPWAADVVKRSGRSATLSTKVDKSTVEDHILRFKVDDDGDGVIEANVGGETVYIRATTAVWGAGKDGKMEPYSRGQKSDDVYSWIPGQTRKAK